MFRIPPPYLWTPLSPQRVKGCTPLTIPKMRSKPKNASRFAKRIFLCFSHLRLRRRFHVSAGRYRQQRGNTSCEAANRRNEKKVQQRRPPPAADTGRSCWGRGQQDTSATQGTKWSLGTATRLSAATSFFPFRQLLWGLKGASSPFLATATTAACGGYREELLGQRPAGCERQRSRRWEPQPVGSRASKVAGAFLVLFWHAKENLALPQQRSTLLLYTKISTFL